MIDQTENKPTPYKYNSGVPVLKNIENKRSKQNHKVMNKLMIACCIPMVVGGAIIFFSIPAEQGLSARIFSLAPIAGCLALHLIIHRFMGKTCHPNHTKEDK